MTTNIFGKFVDLDKDYKDLSLQAKEILIKLEIYVDIDSYFRMWEFISDDELASDYLLKQLRTYDQPICDDFQNHFLMARKYLIETFETIEHVTHAQIFVIDYDDETIYKDDAWTQEEYLTTNYAYAFLKACLHGEVEKILKQFQDDIYSQQHCASSFDYACAKVLNS